MGSVYFQDQVLQGPSGNTTLDVTNAYQELIRSCSCTHPSLEGMVVLFTLHLAWSSISRWISGKRRSLFRKTIRRFRADKRVFWKDAPLSPRPLPVRFEERQLCSACGTTARQGNGRKSDELKLQQQAAAKSCWELSEWAIGGARRPCQRRPSLSVSLPAVGQNQSPNSSLLHPWSCRTQRKTWSRLVFRTPVSLLGVGGLVGSAYVRRKQLLQRRLRSQVFVPDVIQDSPREGQCVGDLRHEEVMRGDEKLKTQS
ncbi:hypothetical protein EYF80_004423 [Liparis tanakae]|uniref:Uncharacterized protein n=1 Tax=Liparis tanakae TaxID=230148 RepID=A0A4Z2J653_9TELE|nr:hypothetical protein EYF80_004423 [Liparis tanakae]